MNRTTALITGAYGGLGRCFADIHAEKGGDLILVGRDTTQLEAQVQELKDKYGANVNTIAADLSMADAAQKVYDTCKENGWQVDYLINNAGFGGQGDFARERSMELDMSMIAVNIETPTRLCKLFLPDFISRGSGKVLNVSSTAALMPGPLQAVYYATKAYVTYWSNALWRELQGTGVTVTALMPGPMETGFAATAGLTDTALFAETVEPMQVAKDGYEGMLNGEVNVLSGLNEMQFQVMGPMVPQKEMLDFVYMQQLKGSAQK